jgi:hypothetical protein
MINFSHSGDFKNIDAYLKRMKSINFKNVLDKYGKRGVTALEEHTPIKSGETASLWGYRTYFDNDKVTITWYNDHVENDVPIAIILQYGHATKNGGYVQGVDYINPAIAPIFEEILYEIWRVITI